MTDDAYADTLDAVFVVDPETGELLEDGALAAAAKAELAADIRARMPGWRAAIKRHEAWAAVRRKAAEDAAALARTSENRARRLKEWAMECMDRAGMTRCEFAEGVVSVATNGGLPPIDVHEAPDAIPDEFCLVERSPDLHKIRKALEAGDTLPFATIMARGRHLRVR